MEITSKTILKNNSIVQAFPLNVQPAYGDRIYLGSRVTSVFIIVKSHWAPLALFLSLPRTITAIEKFLTKTEPKYFTPETSLLKTKMMILTLVKYSLIESIDGQKLLKEFKNESKKNTLVFSIAYLITQPILYFFYPIFAVLPFILIVLFPQFLPRPEDFFWHERFSLSFLSFFIFTWVAGFGHEFAHMLVALSQGVVSKIRISNRLNFLVLETYYPNIHSIPKIWRVRTFLAGIIFDSVLISVTSLLTLVSPQPILKQFILAEWLGIAWQFMFYMRTDIYFVIKEIFEIENLYTYAKNMLTNFALRQKYRKYLGIIKYRLLNAYSVLIFIGTLISVAIYFFYSLPITFSLVKGGLASLNNGLIRHDIKTLIDGIIVTSIEVVIITSFAFAIYKKRKAF